MSAACGSATTMLGPGVQILTPVHPLEADWVERNSTATRSMPDRIVARADAGRGAYASMKAALEVLTRYMAKELGPRHIAANTIAPGAIATDFSDGMVRDNPELNKRVSEMTALGRAGVLDDIGPMFASLLSDDNRWVNAQRIEVSGGMGL